MTKTRNASITSFFPSLHPRPQPQLVPVAEPSTLAHPHSDSPSRPGPHLVPPLVASDETHGLKIQPDSDPARSPAPSSKIKKRKADSSAKPTASDADEQTSSNQKPTRQAGQAKTKHEAVAGKRQRPNKTDASASSPLTDSASVVAKSILTPPTDHSVNPPPPKPSQRQSTPPIPTIDLTRSPERKPASLGFATFSELEAARQRKTQKKVRPVVDASWPCAGQVHQRCLDDRHHDGHPAGPESYKLKPNKGKRPMRTWSASEDDIDWLNRSIFHPSHGGPQTIEPTLKRLSLAPPIQLIPEAASDPEYRHPLLARLLALLTPPDGGPITYDHPALCRQHHRSHESLTHLWTAKYAPKKASEMLGEQNAKSAEALRCWLLEIALKEAFTIVQGGEDQHSSQPRTKAGRKQASKRGAQRKLDERRVITRTVQRKRKSRRPLDSDDESDGLGDFIVSDGEGEEDDTIYAKDVDVSEFEIRSRSCSPRKRLCSEPFSPAQFSSAPELAEASASKATEDGQADFRSVKFDHLTNLILLKGPHGSGKSSAVHAVAEQLGWEVFEVNPGVLRTRKEVDRLVGDVSRNHVLSGPKAHPFRTRQPDGLVTVEQCTFSGKLPEPPKEPVPVKMNAKPMNAFAGMMKAARSQHTPAKREREGDSKAKPALVDERGAETRPDPEPRRPTRQSLILLEEVDVIYSQDKDFWNGVIELVSKSMRPVVLTCNDDSALPLASLPIQTTLDFAPPPASQASAFLQTVALIEGHLVERVELERLYVGHKYVFPADCCLVRSRRAATHHMALHAARRQPDLRRTIMQLQFWCQWAVGSALGGVGWLDLGQDRQQMMLFSANSLPAWPREPDGLGALVEARIANAGAPPNSAHGPPETDNERLQALARAHEHVSFSDAFVDKPAEQQIEEFEIETPVAPGDEVLVGVGAQYEARPVQRSGRQTGASYGAHREWAVEVVARAVEGARQDGLALELADERTLGESRYERLCSTDEYMDFSTSRAFLLPLTCYLTDYAPMVRKLVAIDEELMSGSRLGTGKEVGRRKSRRINGRRNAVGDFGSVVQEEREALIEREKERERKLLRMTTRYFEIEKEQLECIRKLGREIGREIGSAVGVGVGVTGGEVDSGIGNG